MEEKIKTIKINDIPVVTESAGIQLLGIKGSDTFIVSSDDITKEIKDGVNGKDTYEIAVSLGFKGSRSEWLESLKGSKGEDGKNLVITGFKDLLVDLDSMPPSEFKDELWVTKEFGHLHFSDGEVWHDYGQFTMVDMDLLKLLPKDYKPGAMLGLSNSLELEWKKPKIGYEKTDFVLSTQNGSSYEHKDCFGIFDFIMTRKTATMSKIELKFTENVVVSLCYTSTRLSGAESRTLQKDMKIGDVWLLDPDFIINELGEIPVLTLMIDNKVYEVKWIVAHKGEQCKIWFNRID